MEAPKYTPSLLEIEADLRVIVEEPLGSLLLVGREKTSVAEVACFMNRRTAVEGAKIMRPSSGRRSSERALAAAPGTSSRPALSGE